MSASSIEAILMGLLVIDALALAALVLMQHGKGADVGAAFGSGGANTVFGSAGSASFLTKATAWLAIGFFVIAFALAYMAKQRAVDLEDAGIPQVDVGEPVEPAAPAGSAAEEQLTGESEGVDSDVPDV